jgi:hypothetical protein
MKRWAIRAGARTFYIYAPTADAALRRLATNAESIGIKREHIGRAMDAGHWDERTGRLIDREAIIVEDNRKAPGA